jgi:N-methylhydantoinase A/oxoprolinase/acetone carboxylase beta subunit
MPFTSFTNSVYGFSDQARPIEIVNLRLRMIAKGDPTHQRAAILCPADGDAACYAERNVFFAGRLSQIALLPPRQTRFPAM